MPSPPRAFGTVTVEMRVSVPSSFTVKVSKAPVAPVCTYSWWPELLGLLRRAVEPELTPRQRQLFLAVVVEGYRWTRWWTSWDVREQE
jgi:hypothetical protein